MILNDAWIRDQCTKEQPMISPFHGESINKIKEAKVPSYGLSSYGYDIRLGSEFKFLKPVSMTDRFNAPIDPCNFPESLWERKTIPEGGLFVLQPRACVLAVTQEHFRIPRDVLAICMQKSTIARSFFEVVVTPLEPEWEGYLTLEIHNKTDYAFALTPGMGIAQMLFFMGNEPCEVSYKDRGGKYQNQPAEPVTPK